jgi:hypothetical protein
MTSWAVDVLDVAKIVFLWEINKLFRYFSFLVKKNDKKQGVWDFSFWNGIKGNGSS